MEKHTSWLAYATATVSALVSGITLQDMALWIGILTSLATFALNWFYKKRKAKREDEEYAVWKFKNGIK